MNIIAKINEALSKLSLIEQLTITLALVTMFLMAIEGITQLKGLV